MSEFETGVQKYIKATATVQVHFPVDWKGNAFVCCDQCYYFRPQTRRCGLNGTVCEFPGKYVGSECPLEIEEDTIND